MHHRGFWSKRLKHTMIWHDMNDMRLGLFPRLLYWIRYSVGRDLRFPVSQKCHTVKKNKWQQLGEDHVVYPGCKARFLWATTLLLSFWVLVQLFPNAHSAIHDTKMQKPWQKWIRFALNPYRQLTQRHSENLLTIGKHWHWRLLLLMLNKHSLYRKLHRINIYAFLFVKYQHFLDLFVIRLRLCEAFSV